MIVGTGNPPGGSSPFRHGSAVGTIVALGLTIPFVVSLLRLWQSQSAAIMIPLLFAAGILICGVLALVQRQRDVAASFGVSQVILLAVVGLCGASIWMHVPYGLTIAVLIACCFGIIGRRSWLVMIGVFAGSELLAYGVFWGLLGIPIH